MYGFRNHLGIHPPSNPFIALRAAELSFPMHPSAASTSDSDAPVYAFRISPFG